VSLAASRHVAAGLNPTNCRPQVLIAAISVIVIRRIQETPVGACRDVDVAEASC